MLTGLTWIIRCISIKLNDIDDKEIKKINSLEKLFLMKLPHIFNLINYRIEKKCQNKFEK